MDSISSRLGTFTDHVAKQNLFQIGKRPGRRDSVQNAVIKRQPHLQSPRGIENAVVKLRREQQHQVGMESAEGVASGC
jgi:hypothetical protein